MKVNLNIDLPFKLGNLFMVTNVRPEHSAGHFGQYCILVRGNGEVAHLLHNGREWKEVMTFDCLLPPESEKI